MERVGIVVEEIVTASSMQARGLDEVSRGISLMSEVTQTVASNAEESAAASEELLGQAGALAEAVRGFKTRDVETRQDDARSLNARRRKVILWWARLLRIDEHATFCAAQVESHARKARARPRFRKTRSAKSKRCLY